MSDRTLSALSAVKKFRRALDALERLGGTSRPEADQIFTMLDAFVTNWRGAGELMPTNAVTGAACEPL